LTRLASNTIAGVTTNSPCTGSIEVNSWIALGVAGIGLFFGASVLEKYGRRVVGGTRDAWQEVSGWE